MGIVTTYCNDEIVNYGYDRRVYLPKDLKDYSILRSIIKESISINNKEWGNVEFRACQNLLETRIVDLDSQVKLIDIKVNERSTYFCDEYFFKQRILGNIDLIKNTAINNIFENNETNRKYIQYEMKNRRDF